ADTGGGDVIIFDVVGGEAAPKGGKTLEAILTQPFPGGVHLLPAVERGDLKTHPTPFVRAAGQSDRPPLGHAAGATRSHHGREDLGAFGTRTPDLESYCA